MLPAIGQGAVRMRILEGGFIRALGRGSRPARAVHRDFLSPPQFLKPFSGNQAVALRRGVGWLAPVVDGGDSTEHSADAQVLIEQRPGDANAAADPLPYGAIRRARLLQARIPDQRRADYAAIP